MRINLVLLFMFLSTISLAQGVKLSPAEYAAFKTKIEKETQSLKSLQTDFVQNKQMAFLSNDIESKGKMFLTADGNLKWEYTSPTKYSVIFKDNKIIINDNGKKNTVSGKQDIFKKINHLIAGSVSGKLFNDKEFEVTCYKTDNEVVAQLIPSNKTLTKYIKEVNLHFKNNEATVSKVKLIEPSGDFTFIKFVNKKLNVQINPAIFND